MTTKSSEMLQEWMRAQQAFWQSLPEMAKQGGSGASAYTGSSPSNPWNMGLMQWWQAISPQASDPVSQMFQQVVNMGKNFTDLAEQGVGAASAPGSNNIIEDWLSSMETGFNSWAAQLKSGKKINEADFAGLNKPMIDAWGLFAEQMFSVGDFSAAGTPNFEQGKEAFERVLNTPAMGPAREHQEQLKLIARCMQEYQEAESTYKLAFAKLGQRSVEELRQRLQLMDDKQTEVEGLRGFYDLWVEVNEAVYADFAMTDEYQVIYGDLVNSLMALRKEINVSQEKTYQAVNLPTRAEVNALHKRLQEQRRENRRLHSRLDGLNQKISDKAAAKPKVKLKAKKKKSQPPTDDLSKIKGIGPRMNERLNILGITTFAELAALQAKELKALDDALNAGGRIAREKWVKQAASFLKVK